jgi:hypothetical protein
MLNADVSHPDPAEGEEGPTLDPAVAPTAEAASDPAQCLAVEGETLVTTQDVLLVANSPQEPRAPSAAEATTDVADDSAATTEDNVTTEDGDGITDHSNQSARTFASAVPDVEVADGTTPPTEAELADARSSEAPLAQPAEPAGEGDSPQTEQPGVGTAEVAGGEALQAAAIADGDGPSAERLDVNEDGLVTPQDALLIANYLCDPELLALDAAALDVNGDGEITAGDFDAVVDRLGQLATTAVVVPSDGEAGDAAVEQSRLLQTAATAEHEDVEPDRRRATSWDRFAQRCDRVSRMLRQSLGLAMDERRRPCREYGEVEGEHRQRGPRH